MGHVLFSLSFFPPADRVKQSPGRFSKTKQVVLWLDFPNTLVFIHHTLSTVWPRLFCGGCVTRSCVLCVLGDWHSGASGPKLGRCGPECVGERVFFFFLIVDQKNLLWNDVIKAHYQCGCVCSKENMKPKVGVIKPSFLSAARLLPKPHVWEAETCVPTSFTLKSLSSAGWKHSHLPFFLLTWCREIFLLWSCNYYTVTSIHLLSLTLSRYFS